MGSISSATSLTALRSKLFGSLTSFPSLRSFLFTRGTGQSNYSTAGSHFRMILFKYQAGAYKGIGSESS
uniref:Uncharacterized protein n=1 Tax=Picea glauca TaxID=3330 RepID=A0A101LU52_PICGL|nr:hypothetical protein ABT39_MTgene2682 [Picea glauca]